MRKVKKYMRTSKKFLKSKENFRVISRKCDLKMLRTFRFSYSSKIV